jgi:Protein of unknown function (DUF2959)
MTKLPLVAFMVTSIIGVACTSGCAGNRDGNVRAHSTVASVDHSRDELVQAKAEINKALLDLGSISNHVDLKKSYADFSDDIEVVKKREARVRDERAQTEKDRTAYLAKWQENAAQFTNDDLRRSSIDRQAAVKQQFLDVDKAYSELEESYRPFITNLSEVHADLANDLTPAAVDSIKPVVAKITADGSKVQEKIDAVINQLAQLNASLSTNAPAK